MHYPEIYECDCIFDFFREKKLLGEYINIDWIKTQVYGTTYYIPETFPDSIPELEEILKRLNN